MTTSIRTTWGDIALNDGILNFYYEAFKDAPDQDACYDAVRDYIISYVNEHLPDNLTWFPALSEVYVEIDGDPKGYQGQDDDSTVDDMLGDLVNEAMSKADEMLTEDPNVFGPASMTADMLTAMIRDWLADEGYILDDSGIYVRERTANESWTDWQDVVIRETLDLDGDPFCEDGKWYQACRDEEGRVYALIANNGNIEIT